MSQKKVIKLTSYKGVTILIGLDSIIEVTQTTLNNGNGVVSKIVSRGAMVSTNWVIETPDEIYELINSSVSKKLADILKDLEQGKISADNAEGQILN